MFLTSRYRAMLERRESGAVAIVVALVTLVLFGIAALVVDIGAMYSGRRAAQRDADLAALAGVVGLPDQTVAFDLAYDYLQRNIGTIPAKPTFRDGSLANGEILFPATYRIRVVAPPRTVEFGFAGAVGFDEADVTAAATAEIKSPAATMPFYLTTSGASGYSCLKDTAPGGPGGPASAMRAVLLAPGDRPPTITSTAPATVSTFGGETLTVTGDNFRNPAPTVTSVRIDGVEVTTWTVVSRTQITLTTPAHLPGSATLTVTNDHGTASSMLTYVTPPPVAAPTVTALSPTSGPTTGGTTVTVTGTGFTGATAVAFGVTPAAFTVTDATTIVATSPAGTGAVNVRVTGPGGTSAATDANLYTYEVDACVGTTGSFGYLDIPRGTPPTPFGPNGLIQANTIAGIDHSWTTYPGSVPVDTPCRSGVTLIPGAVLDEGTGVNGANCLEVESGNKIVSLGEAFLDGYAEPGGDFYPGRLIDPDDGHDSATLHGRADADVDRIQDYLTVPLADFTNKLATDPDPEESEVNGWISRDIVTCPRFGFVPVLNVSDNPPNGFYPIVGMAAVFIDGSPPNHGFEPSTAAGTQMRSIRAYAFSTKYLVGVFSSGETDTIDYLGSGPKVPVLVHDSADPSY